MPWKIQVSYSKFPRRNTSAPCVSLATSNIAILVLNPILIGLGFRKTLRLSHTALSESLLPMSGKAFSCQAAAGSEEDKNRMASWHHLWPQPLCLPIVFWTKDSITPRSLARLISQARTLLRGPFAPREVQAHSSVAKLVGMAFIMLPSAWDLLQKGGRHTYPPSHSMNWQGYHFWHVVSINHF